LEAHVRSSLYTSGINLLIAAGYLVLSTLACGPLGTALRATRTPVPTAVVPTEELSATPSPSLTSEETLTPTAGPPTPTPGAAACPPSGSPEFDQPTGFVDYPEAIQAYLSAGGGLETLRSRLREWNALPEGEDQVVAGDLNGDGADEVIVSVIDAHGQTIAPSGVLLVFECSGGSYSRLYREGGGRSETFDPSTRLITVDDLTRDGLPDVVYVLRTCGAHTCYERLRILGWDGAQLVNLMDGSLDLPYPSFTVEPARIEAVSGGIGSVGAEPQRRHTEIWTWNGSVFTRTKTIYEPAVYRYHVLLDGDRALLSGDYPTATLRYERAISDDTLKEWGDESGMMTAAEERAQLSAFARWRLVLTYLLIGRPQDAQLAYDSLQEDYSSGTGQNVAQMAHMFWTTYQNDDSITEACGAVIADVESHRPLLDFYNRNYGYANPHWEPKDLCPF
jgi:hypothetical protein